MAYEAEVLLLGRLVLASVFLYNGYNHFADFESRLGYAQYKEVPAPELAVISSGVMLVLGGIGIAAGIYPVISAGALIVFLVAATLLFHDYWSVSDEERENEFNHFLKNVGLLGGTLVLMSSAGANWEYAVGVGLF